MRYDDHWPRYVSVAERKRKVEKQVASLKKKGKVFNPVVVGGRSISTTFWGKAWCENLESYSDYSNRLPRGRSYVRNGSVIDLQVEKGKIYAQVMGSSLYQVVITIEPMARDKWEHLIRICSGKIDSLIELLQGKFSKAVMEIMTERENGLFPKPREISLRCSCPDSARMCKHLAATLYGVGAALDTHPEWLFSLRNVDHLELLSSANVEEALTQKTSSTKQLDDKDLSSIFGIDIEEEKVSPRKKRAKKASTRSKVKAPKAKSSRSSSTRRSKKVSTKSK